MQLFNPHCYICLPFVFLLVRSIAPDPSGNDDDDVQSIISPLLDRSNNPIDVSENSLEANQGWPTDGLFDTNVPPSPIIATDQIGDACPLPPMKEYYQRRKVRRGNACTAPLQLKPEAGPETKPNPGNNDGASKMPGNRISPHSGPLFESAPSWKAPSMIPYTPQKCLDPFINIPVCALHTPDMTNWVERQYRGITVDLPECFPYSVPCIANLQPWCCAIVSLNMIQSEDGSTVLSGTLHGYTCMRMNPLLPNRLPPLNPQRGH